MRKSIMFFCLLLFAAPLAHAGILHNAWNNTVRLFSPTSNVVWNSDGTPAGIQALHNNAIDGDTITMPGGTFNWTSQINITRNIKFLGAGKAATIINDNVPTPCTVMSFNFTAGPNNPEIAGFTVNGITGDPGGNSGIIHIGGTHHAIRVHDIKLFHPASGLFTHGNTWGVIDHSDFYTEAGPSGAVIPITINHGNWPAPDGSQFYGDGSWRDDTHLGSGEGWYMEDDYFLSNGAGGTGVADSGAGANDGGARYVLRHSILENQNVGSHGTETRTRGVRQYEVYLNEFIFTLPAGNIMAKALTERGGTGVIWGNWHHATATGAAGYVDCYVFQTYRDFQSGGAPFGGNPTPTSWDSPDPRLDQCGWGKTLDAVDRVNDGPGGDCPPGYTPCQPRNHRTGGPDWPRNQSEPIYVWNNTWNPVPNNTGSFIGSGGGTITVYAPGRDVIDSGNCTNGTHPCTIGTAKPGYVPYIYPHPLATGGGPTPTPSPTPATTATPTATGTPISTPTVTPSSTPTATSTPGPSGTPVAPSNMVAIAVSTTRINLSWNDNSDNEEIFYLEGSTDGTTFGVINAFNPNIQSTYDEPLTPGTTYWYRARAWNANGYSLYTNIANATTFPGSPTPIPTATPQPTPTVTPTPAPTQSPTATPSPTSSPSQCTVPNFIGYRINVAGTMWTRAGFKGSNLTTNGGGRQIIHSQSLPAGTFASCGTATIRVSK